MDNIILTIALFFPRLSIIFLYFNSLIPVNNTPFILDFLLSVFLPRVMWCILIASVYGFGAWFWVHAVAALLVYSGTGVSASSDK